MAEKENDFLKGNRLDQFFKGNSNDIKDASKNLSANVKTIIKNQNTQITSLKSVDKSLKSIDKNVAHLTKALTSMKNVMNAQRKETQKASKKRDTFKRKNYDKENNDLLGGMLAKLDKLASPKAKAGMLAGFGGLLATGGLIGYMMTGKKELLGNVFKGFNYAFKGLKGIFGIGAKLGKGMGSIAKMFGMKTASSAGKAMSKAGSKGAAKKIPVLGAIIGLALGVNKFRKGDIVGGLLEIGSGAASIVPGAGTAVSVMLDLYLMKRDLTMSKEDKAGESKQMMDFWSKHENLRMIPGVGSIVALVEGVKLWQNGDKMKALEEFAYAVPGVAQIVGIGKGLFSIAEGFSAKKNTKAMAKKNDATLKKRGSDAYGRMLGKLTPDQRKELGRLRKEGGYSPSAQTARHLMHKMGLSDTDAEPTRGDAMSSGEYKIMGISASGIPSVGGLGEGERSDTSDAYYLYKPWNPKLNGIRGDVWNNFMGMATEYYGQTGKKIQINSGFRDTAKQWELWRQYEKDKAAGKNPSPVAYPGRSMHEYGYALDINSDTANDIASRGIMDKWGFDRPVKRGTPKWEPWHIEPKGLKYKKIQSGIGVQGADSPTAPKSTPADALTPVNVSGSGLPSDASSGNLPQGTIARKVTANNPVNVVLSPKDIETLANAFGKQLSKNSKQGNGPIPANTGSPRSNL